MKILCRVFGHRFILFYCAFPLPGDKRRCSRCGRIEIFKEKREFGYSASVCRWKPIHEEKDLVDIVDFADVE